MMSKIGYKLRALGTLRKFDNFFQLLVAHALYPKGIITYVWRGKTLLVDGGRQETAGGVHTVLIGGEYNGFLDRLRPDSVRQVLDLGANVGSFAVLLSDRFPELRKIVMVEGDSTVLPRLYFNVNSALPKRVEIIHGAACGKDGEVSYHQNPTSVGSGIADWSGGDSVVETVASYSLDSLVSRHFPEGPIDICKIDIEGSEYDAVYSLADSRIQRMRLILIEMHGSDADDKKLIDFIVSKGFTHLPAEAAGTERTHGFLNSGLV